MNLGLTSQSLRGVAYVGADYGWLNTPASGRPDVPPEWAPMLLKTPVEGRVIEALSDARARVDFGSDRGAIAEPGRSGSTPEQDGRGDDGKACRLGTVVEVTPASCVIESKFPVLASNRLKVGQRILTRHPLADVAQSLSRPAIGASKTGQPSTP